MQEIALRLPGGSAATRRPRGAWRSALTAAAVTTMLVLVTAATCADTEAPENTVEGRRAESPTLRNKQRLRIGVREDVPYMFYLERSGRRTGFEIEIARELAAELGYLEDRIDWVPIRTLPERQEVLQQNRADMVVANFSMTEEREKYVDFAGPYQLVPQAVLVHRDRKKRLETIADLRVPGVRVCTTTGSTSEQALDARNIAAEPVDTNADCMAGMRSRTYDAFSTDLSILAGLRQAEFLRTGKQTYEILEVAIAANSEQIGVAVPNGDRAMRDLLAYFLDRWQKGPQPSPWMRAYDKTIEPLLDRKYRSQPLVKDPPELIDYDSKAPRL